MTRSKAAIVLTVLLTFTLAGSAGAAPPKGKSKPARRARPAPSLVWHVESLDGKLSDGLRADDPINPASVVKVATTWWALERLGPDHRFETKFFARGRIDHTRGVLNAISSSKGTATPP